MVQRLTLSAYLGSQLNIEEVKRVELTQNPVALPLGFLYHGESFAEDLGFDSPSGHFLFALC